jgi:hypothetical protein
VGADEAGFGGQIGDGFHQFRFARRGGDIEHIDLVIVQATGPQEAAVIGEAHVVRFAASAHRDLAHDLAELLRGRVDIDRYQFVEAVTHAFDAQRPHVHEIFLALDQVGHVGRVAGFVSHCHRRNDAKAKGNGSGQRGCFYDRQVHGHVSDRCVTVVRGALFWV